MNEQAIRDAYDLFVKNGYSDSIDDFKKLIASDTEALNDSYNLFKGNGYSDSIEDYKSLMGLSTVKKKEVALPPSPKPNTTDLPLGIGSLEYAKPTKPVAPAKVVDETPKEKNYFSGKFGDVLTSMDAVQQAVGGVTGIGDVIDDIGRAIGSGFSQGAIVTPANKLLLSGKKSSPEDIQKYVIASKEAEKIGPSDEMMKFRDIYEKEGKGVYGFIKGLALSPGALPEIAISSFANMFNPTSAATAGSVIGGAAAYGALATPEFGGLGAAPAALGSIPYAMGAANVTLETGLTFGELLQEELQKRKLEFNEENVKKVLEDDKAVSAIRAKSVARGATIGFVDALTGRLAGKVGAKLIGNTAASKVKAGLATTGIEAAGGSTGEAAGRLVAGQEMDVAEIGLEGIGEAPMAPISIAAEVMKKPVFVVNNELVTEADVKEIIDNTPANELHKIKFDIRNDKVGYKDIIQDKIVTNSIREEVRQVNPNLDEDTLNEIVDLEKQLQKVEGNKTQSGKDKAASIRSQIKTLQENVQEQTAGEVPVQSGAEGGREMAEGEPQAKPQVTAEEGVQGEITKEKIKTLDNTNIIELAKLSGIESNWDMVGEGDLLSGKSGEDAYTQRMLPEWNRASQLGKINPDSNLTYGIVKGQFGGEDNNKVIQAKDENGVVVGMIEMDNNGGILHLAVAPEFRGKGVSENLYTALKEKNPNADLSKTKNRSIGFEKSLGSIGIVEAYNKAKQNGSNPELVNAVEQLVSSKTQEVAPAVEVAPVEEVAPVAEAVLEVEQYEPITETQVSHEKKFNKNTATDYEEDTRETDSGREVTYLSRVTVEAIDDNTGDAIGGLVKIVDEDKNVSWQAVDLDGIELGKQDFDSIEEAKTALVKNWNKIQKKEFDKEAKKKAKAKEKEAAKKSKFAKDETVRPQPTGDRTGRKEGGTIAPLEGAPSVPGVNGPDPQLVAVAEQYAKANGIPFKRQAEYVKVDEKRAKRIADAYEAMANDPQNPKVKEAYQNLIKQTTAQYKALADAGYKFWFMDLNIPSNAEYASTPYNAIRDLRKNKEMGVFPTTDGYGDGGLTELDVENNPMLADTGLQWPVGGLDGPMKTVLANDLFRAVHDAFGHGLEGAGFRARGEENAWQAHVRLFTGSAIAAITSETRGQNSWLNYGPNGEQNKTAKVEDTVFAEQKVGLMPKWTWTEGRAADMEPKGKAKPVVEEEAGPTAEDLSSIEAMLDLDMDNEDNMQIVLNALDNADKAITKRLRGGANDALLALPLSTVQLVVKTLKALVKGGMMLRDAIRKVSADNNISQQLVKDVLNISEIQDGFNELMVKVGAMIDRQTRRGTPEARMISNIDTLVRNSEVYQNASDSQKKILEREARAKAGAPARRAPSIGRILGVLKDITNVSREDKLKIISQIRQLSKDAAKDLVNEIKEMASSGKITAIQQANIISRFARVNVLNELSVSKFVDYMANVFANAEYANQIDVAKSKLKTAKKNIATKIGIADGLALPLQRLFSIKPTLIPTEFLERYLELVNMFSEKQAVLSLEEKSKVTKDVEAILSKINEEQSLVDELSDRFNSFKDKVVDKDGNLDYNATIEAMLKDGVIDEKEAASMKKNKSSIVPREGKEKKTDEEIAKEKQELITALKDTKVSVDGLNTQDERNLAERLVKLVSSDAVNKLSNNELKNLLKVLDNINNNYLPHYAQLMVEKLTAINNAKTLTSAIQKAVVAPLSGLYSRVKSLITRKGAISEMIRRNPLFNIDQLFGDYKTKDIFNSILNKAAEGESMFVKQLKTVQNILERAEEKVAKSFKLDANKTLMSKFKMMTYLIQLEYDSNKGSKQVNPSAEYLKATIKHIDEGKSQFGERDANMLQEILDKYGKVVGKDEKGKDIIEIDNEKLYSSFNQAEKEAIKAIRDINESLKEKAEYTASIIRGDRINPLTNYVHLNVLHEHQPNDATSGVAFVNDYNNSMRPSTKAKSLIERTGKVSPLNFDVFASAQRGAKFVLMDYNLTEPIRTARKTLNQTIANFEESGRIPKEKREIINAIQSAFEEVVDNILTNSFISTSIADDVADYISKQGYRSVLAGTGRFASELMSNIGFALIADPKAFASGVKNRGVVMSSDAPIIMENVGSKQVNRIFPTDTLSGKLIDTNILKQASGVKGAKSKNPVKNKIQQIWNLSGKKYVNTVELAADALISTPDKLIMRPMWFGSFANEFKKISGEEINFEKIASKDEAYMNKHKEAIDKAKNIADEKSVMTGSTENPFMGILKGTVKPNQSALLKLFNNFNSFMTKFLIFEFVTARTAVNAAIGNGSLTKKQGIALLGAVTTRMVVYTLLTQMLGSGLVGLVYGDEEEEDEKSFWQKLGQAFTSAFTSMIFGRDFGNATKTLVNYGLERANEEYLDFLREGEYDPYKDAIQFSIVPPEKKGEQRDLKDFLLNMGGAFGPTLKTLDLITRKTFEEDKKEKDAIERQKKEINVRIPLEVLGNAGLVPLYKDVRKSVLKDIYKDLEKAESRGSRNQMGKEDMKKYFPDMYNELYGPGGTLYDVELIQKQMRKEKEKLMREMKDEMYNYTPK
jgi:ribosomal protein S18 acetylase RimI-like enzyme